MPAFETKQSHDADRWAAAIIESSNDAIISCTLDGSIISWNRGATRMFGYSRNEMVGQPLSLLVPPEHIDEHAEILANAQQNENTNQYETVHVGKNKAPFDVSLTVFPIRVDTGDRAGVAVFVHDITSRIRTEASLAEKARLLDLSNDAIVARDINDRIIYWNHGATAVYGWTADEAIGQHLHTLLQTEFEIPLEQLIPILYDQEQMEGEVIQVTRDGRRITLLCRWALDRDAEGRPGAILTTYNDITERKQAQDAVTHALAEAQSARAEAEAALQVRDQFLSIASHELRTPLTSLIGNVDMLQCDTSLSAEVSKRMTERISRQAHRLNVLIEQLLDISRLERGMFVMDHQPIDVNTVAMHVVEDVGATLPPTTTLELRCADEPAIIAGDAQRLEQVIQNVLSNAVKYSPAGGSVCVQVHCTTIEAIIEVTDQGIGIPDNAQPHIFEPFYRAANVGTRASSFGVGLHIVREIVGQLRGRIEVESAEGHGSTFRVTLPRLTASTPPS